MSDNNPSPRTGSITLIKRLTPESRGITVRFKVLRTIKAKIVWSKKFSRPFLITEREVADETGKMTLVLWNNDADIVRPGRSYILRNGYVRLRDYAMQLMRGRTGEFQEIDATIDVVETPDFSRPFAWKSNDEHDKTTLVRTFEGIEHWETKGYCSSKDF